MAPFWANTLFYALSACLLGGARGRVLRVRAVPRIFVHGVPDDVPAAHLLAFVRYSLRHRQLAFLLRRHRGCRPCFRLPRRAESKRPPHSCARKRPARVRAVLLERVPFIWKRFSVLRTRHTARDLLRYKKRFFMTVFGIMGCMALLICGFAIKDSVHALSPMQYGAVYRCDAHGNHHHRQLQRVRSPARRERRQVSQLQEAAVDSVTLYRQRRR